ncbi:MAG: tripartite tricarboxylate transporter family receptor, partial [Hyphomicrobiales bacterium]|nr:tripartite tricarboxylate transporter family receptor [Hyphomicrobiales bacterium]
MIRIAGVLSASLLVAAPAAAADFYAGKTIAVLVGAGAGGSYDVYARALANHIGKHIPGAPTMVVKIAGGVGGGVATAIQMEHAAPRDGLTIGIVQQTNVTSQITEAEVAGKYDVTKWQWIGNMAPLRN